MYKLKR